ncbi:arylesterase [Aliamphritea spongicola]|nr:arylesterase [Aliamphritea spongicola]
MKFYRLLFLLVIFSSSASAKTMLVLGDSLSAAYGMQQQQGWVALLQERLSEHFSKLMWSMPVSAAKHSAADLPACLHCWTGTSRTTSFWSWGPMTVYAAVMLRSLKNLRKLMATATESGARVLLLGIRLPPNYGPRYTENFFKLYEQAAKEYKTYRVPFLLENVALDPKMMQSDGLHPNVIAQPVLLDTVWPIMEIMLRKP